MTPMMAAARDRVNTWVRNWARMRSCGPGGRRLKQRPVYSESKVDPSEAMADNEPFRWLLSPGKWRCLVVSGFRLLDHLSPPGVMSSPRSAGRNVRSKAIQMVIEKGKKMIGMITITISGMPALLPLPER